MDNVAELILCDRCSKKAKTLKRVVVADNQYGGNKIMYICLDCYQEHYWEVANDEAIKR